MAYFPILPCLTPSLCQPPLEFVNETYPTKTRGIGYRMVKISQSYFNRFLTDPPM